MQHASTQAGTPAPEPSGPLDIAGIRRELDDLEAVFIRRVAALRGKLSGATGAVGDNALPAPEAGAMAGDALPTPEGAARAVSADALAAPDSVAAAASPALLTAPVSEIRPASQPANPASQPANPANQPANPASQPANPALQPANPASPLPERAVAVAQPWLSRLGVEMIVGQTWLLIGGIVALVIGIGYFLGYSFERDWIGPAGRVALAYAAGAGLLGAGALFHRRNLAAFGLSLVGGGIATLYFASFAAFAMYGLISQPAAFAVMVGITAMAGVLAVSTDSKWLAVLGLVGGFATPLMLRAGHSSQVALMTYLAILTGGVFYVARRKRWSLLNSLAFGFTWLLVIGWFAVHYSAGAFRPTLGFVNLFWFAYVVIPIAYHVDRSHSGPIRQRWMPALSSAIAFALTYTMLDMHASERYASIAAMIYGTVLLGLARHVYRRSRDTDQVPILLTAFGAGMWLITVPLLLSGHWITVFWSGQIAAWVWAATRLGDRRLLVGALAFLAAIVAKLFIDDYAAVFGLAVDDLALAREYTDGLMARVVSAAAVIGALVYSARRLHRAFPVGSRAIPEAVATAATAVVFVVLTIEVSAMCADYVPAARLGALSVLWALFAAALCAAGILRDSARARRAAMALFLATGAKAVLIDLQDLQVPFRIMSFVAMGLILIAASYLYHRYRDRIGIVAARARHGDAGVSGS